MARVADLEVGFRAFVEMTWGDLVRIAGRVVGDDAEDVVQEAYLRMHRVVRGSKPLPKDARAWARTITVRAALDAQRSLLRRLQRLAKALRPASEPPRADAAYELAQVSGWLERLPPAERAALVLSVLEGMTSAEIGAHLGCSAGAVEQRIVRARRRLRALQERV